MGRDLAAEYERLYPGAITDESQKQERMERLLFKEEASTLRRTGRNRGIIVPALPWQKEDREGLARQIKHALVLHPARPPWKEKTC